MRVDNVHTEGKVLSVSPVKFDPAATNVAI